MLRVQGWGPWGLEFLLREELFTIPTKTNLGLRGERRVRSSTATLVCCLAAGSHKFVRVKSSLHGAVKRSLSTPWTLRFTAWCREEQSGHPSVSALTNKKPLSLSGFVFCQLS